ncbi:hypothetical protein J7J47_03630 [Halomonas sp. ISL-60]|uniref:hypothetical protein n=1 Tax=Halomonas sp. ISL-56 TaxID=2819149 RepID=UPI001BE64A84|nr:hypothetical protein [Halomonas sp. ISL-56]MBT2771320.1 hypothetical protein [Halomonas sp. ISL-60]MBT2800677.1 hypothetical protein [Halomonas sp. ISL-56]
MKFKLLKDAPHMGKKGDIVNVNNKQHIAIMKFNNYINDEYKETNNEDVKEPDTKPKTKRTTKKTNSDSDSK